MALQLMPGLEIPEAARESSVFYNPAADHYSGGHAPMTPGGKSNLPTIAPAFPPGAKIRGGNSKAAAAKAHQTSRTSLKFGNVQSPAIEFAEDSGDEEDVKPQIGDLITPPTPVTSNAAATPTKRSAGRGGAARGRGGKGKGAAVQGGNIQAFSQPGGEPASHSASPGFQQRLFPPSLSIPPPPQLFFPGSPPTGLPPTGSPPTPGGTPNPNAPCTPRGGMIRPLSQRLPATPTSAYGSAGGSGSGSGATGGTAVAAETLKRKRPRFLDSQLAVLEAHFAVEQELAPASKKQLAAQLGVKPRQVCVWFQNRKVRQKTRERESDLEEMQAAYAQLQAQCRELQDDYELLKSDYQELLLQNTQLFDMMADIEQQLMTAQGTPDSRPSTSQDNQTTSRFNQATPAKTGGASDQSEQEVEIPSARPAHIYQHEAQQEDDREKQQEMEHEEEEEEEAMEENDLPWQQQQQEEQQHAKTAEQLVSQPQWQQQEAEEVPCPPISHEFRSATAAAAASKPASYDSTSFGSSLDDLCAAEGAAEGEGAPPPLFALPPPALPLAPQPASAEPAVAAFAPLPLFAELNRTTGGFLDGQELDGWMDGDAATMQQSAGLLAGLTAKSPACYDAPYSSAAAGGSEEAGAEDEQSDSEAVAVTGEAGAAGGGSAFSGGADNDETSLPAGEYCLWKEGQPQTRMDSTIYDEEAEGHGHCAGGQDADGECGDGEFANRHFGGDLNGAMRMHQEPFDLLGSMESTVGEIGGLRGMGPMGMILAPIGMNHADEAAAAAAADEMTICGFDLHAFAAFSEAAAE